MNGVSRRRRETPVRPEPLTKLVRFLAVEFPDSVHVTDIGLDTATDREIWSYAGEHDLIIVSKDSDFRQLAFLHGPPPKAIWVRIGNASTIDIFHVLRSHVDAIEVFSRSVDEALLVVPAIVPLTS